MQTLISIFILFRARIILRNYFNFISLERATKPGRAGSRVLRGRTRHIHAFIYSLYYFYLHHFGPQFKSSSSATPSSKKSCRFDVKNSPTKILFLNMVDGGGGGGGNPYKILVYATVYKLPFFAAPRLCKNILKILLPKYDFKLR